MKDNEKLKRQQFDRFTAKKEEFRFLSEDEIKKIQIKYSTFHKKKK